MDSLQPNGGNGFTSIYILSLVWWMSSQTVSLLFLVICSEYSLPHQDNIIELFFFYKHLQYKDATTTINFDLAVPIEINVFS